ncbi:hypothetical protein T265_15719, partial [Opisthorchis viverrini]
MSGDCLSTEPTIEDHILRMFESDFSEKDKEIVKITEQSVSLLNGHYQLPLPWNVDRENLPSNLDVAEKRISYLTVREESWFGRTNRMNVIKISMRFVPGYGTEYSK